MTTVTEQPRTGVLTTELTGAIESATARIAPAWPLDRMIAVKPYLGLSQHPVQEAAATLTSLAGSRMLMPREWYRAQWEAGRFTRRHIEEALVQAESGRPADPIEQLLYHAAEPPLRLRLLTDLADAARDLGHELSWQEFVTRHISQACAAWFDQGQARWTPGPAAGLYDCWLRLARADRGPRLLMGLRGATDALATFPADPAELIASGVAELGLDADECPTYFTALLMSVHGWASTCAFRRWEARLTGGDDGQIVQLLAVRLAWDLLLFRIGGIPAVAERWRQARAEWPLLPGREQTATEDDWILQRALELAWQETIVSLLQERSEPARVSPEVQAFFCIDVRSEVIRRHLEAVAPAVQTLGFAGFFGLPLAYRPLAGPARPQVPGLLAPALEVRDFGDQRDNAEQAARGRAAAKAISAELSATPGSIFSLVELTGLASVPALLRDTLGLGNSLTDLLRQPAVDAGLGCGELRTADGVSLTVEDRVALAARILTAMSLTREFAPMVALIGHGSSCSNNPQAAGLQCGACGGQTGEISARTLARLLNDPAVRAGLPARGIELPQATHVIAGLHDTTTDEVTLFDRELVPASHQGALAQFDLCLTEAGRRSRSERAPALGLSGLAGPRLDHAFRRRARDWAEVRPEWGLARNAGFIVAPRERTRGKDLGGRVFLHDYRWEQDPGFQVLELIMTAPMIVTHWINMQYYASTVDPVRFGSGNKVLHNVVGGRLGVFEGAGGDLRTGLALQSVHDGRNWYHEPLRLTVFIEAPAEAIAEVLAKHPPVRDLVRNEWLFLCQISPADGSIRQLSG